MFIYLDESGDLGFDFQNKSPSTYFVITLLVFSDRHGVLRVNSAVKHTIKHKLDIETVQELKSTKILFPVKEYFYRNLTRHLDARGWGVYSIVLDKKELLEQTTNAVDIHRLYNILAHRVLEQIDFSNVVGNKIHLVVDRWKSSKERVIFNGHLRSNLEALLPINVSLNITHELSHCSSGLQAVDLFSSGFFKKYVANDVKWYNVFKNQIIWEGLYKF